MAQNITFKSLKQIWRLICWVVSLRFQFSEENIEMYRQLHEKIDNQ